MRPAMQGRQRTWHSRAAAAAGLQQLWEDSILVL
jgi:hypothetical protein